MTNPKVYEQTLVELGNLLGKLLKVIRHPDPSAHQKKKQLFDKYHLNMRLFGKSIQEEWSWVEATRVLEAMPKMVSFTVERSEHKVVLDRLKKDLGEYLAPKASFPEFEPAPQATRPPKKKHLKQKPLQQKAATTVGMPKKPIEDAETLMKLATMNPKEREATNDLQRLIDAINKVGPDALENRIQTVFKKTKQ